MNQSLLFPGLSLVDEDTSGKKVANDHITGIHGGLHLILHKALLKYEI